MTQPLPPPSPPSRPRHLSLAMVLGVVALLGYALVAPSARVDVDRPALALGGLEPGMSALWLLAVRIVTGFPIGDLGVRVRLVSLLAGAAAVTLMLVRSLAARRQNGAGAGAPKPAPPAAPVEIVAALWGVTTVALSRSFVAAASNAGPAAMGVLQALALLALAERVARAPADRRAGLWLALLGGLCAGGPLAAAALGWPVGALVVVRAFRRGVPNEERWPALAPLPFLGGLAIGLAVTLGASGRASGLASGLASGPARFSDVAGRLILLPAFRAASHLSARALVASVVELADQVGILAAMVAVAGLSGLRRTSLLFTLWTVAAGLLLRAAFGPDGEGESEGTLGMILAATALALPLGTGIVRLAERLGRARLPAAAALGVIVATWPFLAR